jgi:hypothetical protein
MTAHSYVPSFLLFNRPPSSPGFHFLPSDSYCTFQRSFFRFNMTLLQYHVIYMSLPHLGFLARLVFSGWYYSPHSLPPVLIPFQAILMVINVTPRH